MEPIVFKFYTVTVEFGSGPISREFDYYVPRLGSLWVSLVSDSVTSVDVAYVNVRPKFGCHIQNDTISIFM